jgi:hypothetical protein
VNLEDELGSRGSPEECSAEFGGLAEVLVRSFDAVLEAVGPRRRRVVGASQELRRKRKKLKPVNKKHYSGKNYSFRGPFFCLVLRAKFDPRGELCP